MVNNPTGTTLTDAHLFMEFVNITGTVTSEVPVTTELPPGPNVVPVDWNTAGFSPAYDPAQDYIVMAFLTDYQGNILDTAARPLSSFQEDPKPAVAMAAADETWDFGTAQQGTLLQRTFTLGSVGYVDLLTYLGTTSGLTVTGSTSRSLAPGDTATYTVTLQHAVAGRRRIQQGNQGAHQRPGAPGEDDHDPGKRDRHAARRARRRDDPAAGCAGDSFGQPGRLGGVHAHAGA